MPEVSVLQQFYRMNRNLRTKYLDKLASLPAGELLRDRGSSHPSLLDIFTHIVEGYDFWFSQVLCKTHGPQDERTGKILQLDEARKLDSEIGGLAVDYVSKLSEKDLDRKIELPWENVPAARLGDICWHMVEEELQHRGEINALLWQMDIDPPIGQYSDWLEAAHE